MKKIAFVDFYDVDALAGFDFLILIRNKNTFLTSLKLYVVYGKKVIGAKIISLIIQIELLTRVTICFEKLCLSSNVDLLSSLLE